MARKQKGKLLARAAARLDLPPEAVLGSFGVRMIENTHIQLENYGALLTLTEGLCRVAPPGGTVTVEGSGLTCERMEENLLSLRGSIKAVTLSYKEAKG